MTPTMLMIIGVLVVALSIVIGGINFMFFAKNVMGFNEKKTINGFAIHIFCAITTALGSLTAISGLVWYLLIRFG